MKRTRFRELGYQHEGRYGWRFYDLTGDKPAAVGPLYASEAELLADLTRYARDSWGLE